MPFGVLVYASIHPLPCTRKLARTPSHEDALELRGRLCGFELTGRLQDPPLSTMSTTVPTGTEIVLRLLATVSRM
jgi:hypothetical protein